MLYSLSSLSLVLTFFLPTTLALAPRVLPVLTPASNVLPQDATTDFTSLRTSLNNTSTDVPLCQTEHQVWDPPVRSDCDAIIEAVLLTPGAIARRPWTGTGTFPIWQTINGGCRLFVFVKDPVPDVWVNDQFELVQLAVGAAKILRSCVGDKTPNLGGEVAVGPNKKFVAVVSGRRHLGATS